MSLEDRVAALEAQMVEALRLPGEARVLASAAHEESGTVSSALGRHGRLINGWGEQLNARIDVLDNRMGSFDQRMGGLDNRMAALDQRMGGVESVVGGLQSEMGGLKSRVADMREGFAHLVRLIQGQPDQDHD
jgi:archaellum component FlaC